MKKICSDYRELFQEAMKKVFIFHGLEEIILIEIQNEYFRLLEEQGKIMKQQLSLRKMYHGNQRRFDGFDFIAKVNKIVKNRYRVSFKWYVFHIYKIYADNREHHIGQYDQPKEVLKALRDDLKIE